MAACSVAAENGTQGAAAKRVIAGCSTPRAPTLQQRPPRQHLTAGNAAQCPRPPNPLQTKKLMRAATLLRSAAVVYGGDGTASGQRIARTQHESVDVEILKLKPELNVTKLIAFCSKKAIKFPRSTIPLVHRVLLAVRYECF